MVVQVRHRVELICYLLRMVADLDLPFAYHASLALVTPRLRPLQTFTPVLSEDIEQPIHFWGWSSSDSGKDLRSAISKKKTRSLTPMCVFV